MVRVVNESTGWDRPEYAGPYIVLDIGDFSFAEWLLLQMRHIADYRAPVVLHPILLKQLLPLPRRRRLRATSRSAAATTSAAAGRLALGYFEPWNQQRFDPSEPYIDRVQWRSAYKSFRANQAHLAAQHRRLMRRTTRYVVPAVLALLLAGCSDAERQPATDDPDAEQQPQRDRGHAGRRER